MGGHRHHGWGCDRSAGSMRITLRGRARCHIRPGDAGSGGLLACGNEKLVIGRRAATQTRAWHDARVDAHAFRPNAQAAVTGPGIVP
jgi:hypothetical protein